MTTTPGPPFGAVPLSPTSFLDRSRVVHRDRPAFDDGERAYTYAQMGERCERLAGGLVELGVAPGDRVSVLAPNTNVALEATFGVPWAGAVINALNTRLSTDELAYVVGHCGSRVLLADVELEDQAAAVASAVDGVQVVVDSGPGGAYERLLDAARPCHRTPAEDAALLSINYTSGTTGHPKGVMYAHRGAYLQALAMATQTGISSSSVFLWTLPMFHCNGWCFPWAVTAVGGLHVGLRRVEPTTVWASIRNWGVTHFNAAPTVLQSLAASPDARDGVTSRVVRVATGGAPPNPALLVELEGLGIEVTHLYGLTETYGPAVICDWRAEWDGLPAAERAALKARQGVVNIVGEPLRVVDADGNDVAQDGSSLGEVLLRGNNVMLGYYRDEEATAQASSDGWFRTGDLGVLHRDGYLELRDRRKDVIVSGGENIASIEVEQALASHPAVLEAAVVAAPDAYWGEIPVAFVSCRPGATVTADELVEHVKSRIARYKAPRQVEFTELPKTATGKVQKFALRERLRHRQPPAASTR